MVTEAKRMGVAMMIALFVAALPVTVSFAYTTQYYPQQNYQLYECYDYSYGSYYSYTPCPTYQQPVYQPTYYYDWYYQPQPYYYDYSYYNYYDPYQYQYSYSNISNVNINNAGYYGWY